MNGWAKSYLEQGNAFQNEEESSFWFRRYATSLSIGNGAGALAVAGYAGSAAPDFEAALATPFAIFAVGIILSGLLPLLLSVRHSLQVAPKRFEKIVDEKTKPEEGEHKHPIFWATIHWASTRCHYILALLASAIFAAGLWQVYETFTPSSAPRAPAPPLRLARNKRAASELEWRRPAITLIRQSSAPHSPSGTSTGADRSNRAWKWRFSRLREQTKSPSWIATLLTLGMESKIP